MTSTSALAGLFVLSAAASLFASARFVVRIERLGARLALSEAVLGLVAAFGADLPEITSSVTALVHHQHGVAAGVVLGSNLFNLASLLGLGALAAGWIALHRRVVVLAGIPSLVTVALTLALLSGFVAPWAVVVVFLGVLVPYTTILESPSLLARVLPAGSKTAAWVRGAVREDELELEESVLPVRGSARDGAVGLAYLAVVVGASGAMERVGSVIGERSHWSSFLIGGVVLAIVTSLPNAVAGIYLAMKGRGAAALSTAMHSNILNILIGMAVPALFVGVSGGTRVAWWFFALTLGALVLAYVRGGLDRFTGGVIVAAYLGFLAYMFAA